MKTKNTRIETLEQLVALATRSYANEYRYDLGTYLHSVWDDKEAGTAWENEKNILQAESKMVGGKPVDWLGSPEYEAWRERRPSEHKETTYWLSHRSSSWHNESIELSEELGKQIEKIWTLKQSHGFSRRVGTLTLAGILKRLGQTDIGQRVAAVKKAADEKQQSNHRAASMRNVFEKLESLDKAIALAKEAGCDLGDGNIETLRAMAKIAAEDSARKQAETAMA